MCAHRATLLGMAFAPDRTTVQALPDEPRTVTRRNVLTTAIAACAATYAPRVLRAQDFATGHRFTLLRQPNLAEIVSGGKPKRTPLQRTGERWTVPGAEVHVIPSAAGVELSLTAPTLPVHRVHLRWHSPVSESTQVLGDAWERSYADLAWLPLRAERVLPWYFLCRDGATVQGAGVKTGPGALAFWQVDTEGISLWLDVRNGGNGVVLGQRTLPLATVIEIPSQPGQTPWQAAGTLCRTMVAGTTVARKRGAYDLRAIYGSNDWYYAYGKNTAAGIVRDAALIRELSPVSPYTPFCVVDDGYQDTSRFPSMPRLAEDIRKQSVAPGIWVRPTRAPEGTATNLLLPPTHWANHGTTELAYDPTVPEARARVLAVVQQACDWGYDFIKHDFTTWELLGQWGFQMGASPTRPGWAFNDGSLTNAEIIRGLYTDIRRTAGEDRIVLGCNTIGHLSVGLFDGSRTGDDVSGRDWERTRHMGVNTLAFRLPQNGVFFATDADCVAITPDISWAHTEAWLQAVANSGSILLVSPDPAAMGLEQKRAVRNAFQQAATAPSAEPLDWLETSVPKRWRTGAHTESYQWLDPAGADPFVF